MKKNIVALLFSLFAPLVSFGAIEKENLLPKDEIRFSPQEQSISVYSVDFSQEEFLQTQTAELIPYINFSENLTLCTKNEFFRTLLTYDKLGPRASAFKQIIKKFNILILYKEGARTGLITTSKERLAALMPDLQFIIVFCKKDKAALARKIQIKGDIAPYLHALADVNFNIFPLDIEGKTLKQIIKKWPDDRKYNETSLDFFKTEEEKEQERKIKEELEARLERERLEREQAEKEREERKKLRKQEREREEKEREEREIKKEKERKEAAEQMRIAAKKKKPKRRCLDLIEN